MNIVIRRKAADDLERIFAWIAEENPPAARVVLRRLRDRIARLATPGLDHMGRPACRAMARKPSGPAPVIAHVVVAPAPPQSQSLTASRAA